MAGASGILAGKAYVQLSVSDNKLLAGLKRASASMQAFGKGITSIASKAAALDLAKILPLAHAAKFFADVGSALIDMSDRTGIAVEKLDELGFAAQQSGSSMEELEVGIKKMQDNLGTAFQDPAGASAKAFERLGIAAEELKSLSPDEQFKTIADAISKIDNPASRASAAIDVFGKAGTKLLPMLKGGRAGLEEVAAEARRLGLIMSAEDAAAAEKFGDMLSALWATLKRVWATVGSALVPVLEDVAKWLSTAGAAVGKWIKENKQLVTTIFLGAIAFIALEVAIAAVGMAISGMGVILGVVASGLAIVGNAIVFLVSPIGLVIAGITALGVVLALTTDFGGKILQWLGDRFTSLKDTATTAFKGISDALAAGDLALAGKVAMAGLQVIWAEALFEIQSTFTSWKAEFHKAWISFWDMELVGLRVIANKISNFFTGWATNLLDFWNDVKLSFGVIDEKEAMAERDAIRQAGAEHQAQEDKNLQNFIANKAKENIAARKAVDEQADVRIRAQRKALDDAKAELAVAVKQAEEAKAKVAPSPERPGMPGMPDVDSLLSMKSKSKGTFSAAVASTLGSDDLAQRTANGVEEVVKNTREANRILRKINLPAFT